MVLGLIASQGIWLICCLVSFFGYLFLFKEKALSERWFLLVSFLFSCLFYFVLRYRISLYLAEERSIDLFFAGGSFIRLEKWVLIGLAPLFYAITVLKIEWVLRIWVTFSFIFFLPLLLKLALLLSGAVEWVDLAHIVAPDRVL